MVRDLNNSQVETRLRVMVSDLRKTKERMVEVSDQVKRFDLIKEIDESLHSLEQFAVSSYQIVLSLHISTNNNNNNDDDENNDGGDDGLESVSKHLSVRQQLLAQFLFKSLIRSNRNYHVFATFIVILLFYFFSLIQILFVSNISWKDVFSLF